MSQYENSADPAFRSTVRASGLAEVWTHTHDNLKFGQFGWRCTTIENSFSDQSLVGNWLQQRFDTDRMVKRKQLTNKDAEETWNTTYRSGYNKSDILQDNQASLELMRRRTQEKNAFPFHQPETDPASFKHHYNSFSTTQRAAYGTLPKEERMKKYKNALGEEILTGPLLDRGHNFLSQKDNASTPAIYR